MKIFSGKVWVAVILLGFFWAGVSKLPKDYRFVIYRFLPGYLEIVTAEPGMKNGYIVRLPNDLWIDTVSGKGEWRIESLPDLQEKFGSKWLRDTVGETLGNGVAISYNKLPWRDRLSIWRLQKNPDLKFVEVEKSGGILEKTAPDGEKIKYLGDRWLQIKKQVYYDSRVSSDEIYIVVENASGIEGVGTRAAESIDIAGGQVFDVRKSDTVVDDCQLAVNAELKDNSLINWLEERFKCEVAIGEVEMVVLKVGRYFGEEIKYFL